MKKQFPKPKRESENFHTQHERLEPPEPLDHAKEIADLAWSIDFAQQTPERIKKEVENVLIAVKKSEQNES